VSRQTTLADIDRAYALLSNHTALKILDALSHGRPLNANTLTAGQQATTDAIALLGQMGLVNLGRAMPSSNQMVQLTPRGHALVELLEDISHDPT
jgi:hypothetical protein